VLAFFDTNVLVYCTDTAAPEKQAIARRLVAQASLTGEATLSTQVLIELFHTLTRKQKLPPASAQSLVRAYGAWPVVASDYGLVDSAIETSVAHQLSIWDAMVVVAATRAGADTLYSEDLSDGQRFGELTVVNPFTSTSAA
jgi:predicted nucleic acid-binding protein